MAVTVTLVTGYVPAAASTSDSGLMYVFLTTTKKWLEIIYSLVNTWKKIQYYWIFEVEATTAVKIPMGELYPLFQQGNITQKKSRNTSADYVNFVWLMKVCNSRK